MVGESSVQRLRVLQEIQLGFEYGGGGGQALVALVQPLLDLPTVGSGAWSAGTQLPTGGATVS